MMTFAYSGWRRRHRRDQSSDDIRIMVTTSGRGQLKEDLESSTWRRHRDCKATPYKGSCRSRCEERCVFLRYIVLPNWFHEAHLETSTSNAQDACNADAPKSSGNSNPTATSTNPPADHTETLAVENLISIVSSPVPTACLNDSTEPSSDTRLISKRVTSQDDTPSLDNILTLTNMFEDILGVTTNTDDTNGVEADLGNMETTITASPTPTLRIHKDHPKSQIIGPVDTLIQTRNKSKETEEQSFIATIHQKTNPALLQVCLFSCFLSQVEPKKIYDALQDPSWDPEFPARVYKVEKAMYGLHQAPRAWYGTLSKYLLTNGFQRVLQKEDGIFLSQDKYVGDILKKFGYSDVRSANTPMDKENPWGKDGTGKDVDLHLYNKNGKCVESEKSLKQLQLKEEEKPKKTKKEWPKTHTRIKSYASLKKRRKEKGHICNSSKVQPQGPVLPTFQSCGAQERVMQREGEGSRTPTEPHHIPTSEVSQSSQHELPSPLLPPVPAESLPTVIPSDNPLLGGRLDEGEEAAERVSDDKEEMATVLTSMDAASILTSGGVQVVPTAAEVATASVSIPTGGGVVSTASPTIPTASPIFTTATESTPYTRRKGKETMVESKTPMKKKVQEQIDVQLARELEEEMARDAQRMNEQIAQDAEIARIHAEEELQMLIDGLDRNNETVAKYLQEYYQFAAELPIEKRIELICDLVKYQDHYAKILKYQTQQRKLLSRKQQKEFYMSVLKSHAGWKTRHFKGMTLEEIKEKFDPVWNQFQDFISIEEVPKEKLKEMMELIPVEEVYVEALQVNHPTIDWEVHTDGERSYWKIVRLGGSTTSYQFFVDLLKHFDREDLNQLWALVKETLNIRPATSDKEMKLWVELKRLYEPYVKDQLWTHTQNLMHALVEWKLGGLLGIKCIRHFHGSDEFPLPEQLTTAYEDKFPLLIQSDATVKKIALLLKTGRYGRSGGKTEIDLGGKSCVQSIQYVVEMSHQREHAANLSTHTSNPSRRFNYICYDDDYDYEERSRGLSYNGNEELNTIPEKESDEFIKSSDEDLVPIPSKSKDTSGSDSDDVELLLHRDPSMSVASILEGFIDEPPLEENDDLFDLESKNDKWKKILYDAPINYLMTEDKVFDPGIHDQIVSPTYDCQDFEDSRARGFVHHPLELLSLAYRNPIS
nr:reverse transcriptase [Tanacetum cinerariifolium]